MSLPDTVKALAQTVPNVASPVSWETAVFGFASVVALYLGKTLKRVDEKVSQTLVLLHGVPEQQGKGGIVTDVKELRESERMHGAVHDHHLARIESLERKLKGED